MANKCHILHYLVIEYVNIYVDILNIKNSILSISKSYLAQKTENCIAKVLQRRKIHIVKNKSIKIDNVIDFMNQGHECMTP